MMKTKKEPFWKKTIPKLEKHKRITTCLQLHVGNRHPKIEKHKRITTFLQPNVGNKHFQIGKTQEDNYMFAAKCWKQTSPNWKNTRG